MVHRLAEFIVPYQQVLETEAVQHPMHLYLQGLLSHLPGKNAEDIAALVNVERQVIQDFIGIIPWDHRPLVTVLIGEVADRLLRQASLGEEDCESKLETSHWNPVGNHSHPVRVSHPPEASLASSPAMAARSVDSECKSRVMEPRNKAKSQGAFVVIGPGAMSTHCMGLVGRSCRGLRAGQMHIGVP
jgi:hypothetical protein